MAKKARQQDPEGARVLTTQDIANIAERAADRAVAKAIEEGRRRQKESPENVYKDCERRLYALPVLMRKVKKDQDKLQELIEYGIHGHSKCVARLVSTSGMRISDDDIRTTHIESLQRRISLDEYEINTINEAIEPLTSDQYYRAISGRYFDKLSDEDIGKEIPCDPSTVRRNRGRLMHEITVALYGAAAL